MNFRLLVRCPLELCALVLVNNVIRLVVYFVFGFGVIGLIFYRAVWIEMTLIGCFACLTAILIAGDQESTSFSGLFFAMLASAPFHLYLGSWILEQTNATACNRNYCLWQNGIMEFAGWIAMGVLSFVELCIAAATLEVRRWIFERV